MPHALLNLLRIVSGLLFMQHGAQKLFAVLGRDTPAAAYSMQWFAGVFEWWGGLLIVLGLFTRPVAFLLAGQMMVAYFLAHQPRGWIPIENGGELALLYFVVFLYISARGGGAFSLDGLIAARKRAKVAE